MTIHEAPSERRVDDAERVEISRPRQWAAGIPGITHSVGPAVRDLGVSRAAKLLTSMNPTTGSTA